ncbi:MAG: hypothetical protein H6686_11480 [Fibrobacteria bacterium]|nr:hypothetical protein [Fibrobacteria bacterium]
MSSKKKSSPSNGRRIDIEGVVTKERLRPLQFVHGAFLASAVGVSVLTFLAKPNGTEPRGMAIAQLLALAGLVLWVVGFALALWLFQRGMRRETLLEVASSPWRGPKVLADQATEPDKLVHHIQKHWTRRLTLWILGPLTTMLSVQVALQGNLAALEPKLVSQGVLPMGIYLLLLALTFPTARRIRILLEKSMKS